MKNYIPFFFLVAFCSVKNLYPLVISPDDARIIGDKIWKNECAGSVEGLTSWNEGENFASLGIGHFIWYPVGRKERFHETFPSLLTFLEKEKAAMPSWLKKVSGCPWTTRVEFYKNIESPEMKSLRQFLYDTRYLQAVFIANRLESALPQLLEKSSKKEKEKITAAFQSLAKDPKGLYALMDYVNFKGVGISHEERYQGVGWGLLQVLQMMPDIKKDPLTDFVLTAKSLLSLRVQNAPPERHEDRWLKGWYNRLDTYLQTP